jgi:hypothetical protein
MLFSLIFSLFLFAQEEKVLQELEQAEKMEDGTYFYNTKDVKKSKKKTTRGGEAIEQSDGTYYYDTSDVDQEDKKKDPKKAYGAPKKIRGSVHNYEYERSPQNNSVTFQYFRAKFEDFKEEGRSFKNVYGDAVGGIFDYEWQLKTSFAKFGLIASSGILVADGSGSFTSAVNAGLTPKEEFKAFFVPALVKIRINLEFMDTQYFVPFVEGGAGAIGILERRDDGDRNTTAYTPVFTFAGGIALLLDWMMAESIARLDNDSGVNHMWLVGTFQVITATDDEFDLSDAQIAAGLKVDF